MKITMHKTMILSVVFIWVSHIRKEQRLRVSENRVFVTKRDEIIEDWRKLHNEELPAVLFANFY
jgi:cell division protein FtsL